MCIYMQALTTLQKEFIASKDTECITKTSFVQPQENIAISLRYNYAKDINDFIRIIKIKAHFKITSRKERRDSIHKEFFRIKVGP